MILSTVGLLPFLLFHLLASWILCSATRGEHAPSSLEIRGNTALFSRAPRRKVRWVFNLIPETVGEVSVTDEHGNRRVRSVIASHSALWIDGDENNRPKKIEIGNDDPNFRGRGLYIRDFHFLTSSGALQPGPYRYVIKIGKTSLDNDAITRVAAYSWYRDPVYRSGIPHASDLNTCHNFIVGFLANLPLRSHCVTGAPYLGSGLQL